MTQVEIGASNVMKVRRLRLLAKKRRRLHQKLESAADPSASLEAKGIPDVDRHLQCSSVAAARDEWFEAR